MSGDAIFQLEKTVQKLTTQNQGLRVRIAQLETELLSKTVPEQPAKSESDQTLNEPAKKKKKGV